MKSTDENKKLMEKVKELEEEKNTLTYDYNQSIEEIKFLKDREKQLQEAFGHLEREKIEYEVQVRREKIEYESQFRREILSLQASNRKLNEIVLKKEDEEKKRQDEILSLQASNRKLNEIILKKEDEAKKRQDEILSLQATNRKLNEIILKKEDEEKKRQDLALDNGRKVKIAEIPLKVEKNISPAAVYSESITIRKNDQLYDFQFKINNIIDLQHGWQFVAPAASDLLKKKFIDNEIFECCNIVSILGHFSKGKTFVFNQIYKTQFPSGLVEHTEGLSMKLMDNILLIDTVGTYSPVNLMNKEEVVKRKATEMFLQDIVFMISDYIIIVINDLTWPDQEFIEALAYRLSNNLSLEERNTKSVFIIHNYKEASTNNEVEKLFKEQVILPYSEPDKLKNDREFRPPSIQPNGWYHSKMHGINFRHFVIGRDSTPGGANNHKIFKLLSYQLQTLHFAREFRLKDELLRATKTCISSYVKNYGDLQWDSVTDESSKLLCTLCPTSKETIEPKHKLSYQPSGLGVNLTYSSFSPSIDRIDIDGTVHYFFDLPAVKEVKLRFSEDYEYGDTTRVLIITGQRDKPEEYELGQLTQGERKLGIFERKLAIKSDLKLQHFEQTNNVLDFLAPVTDGVLHLQFQYTQPKYQNSKTSPKKPPINLQTNQKPPMNQLQTSNQILPINQPQIPNQKLPINHLQSHQTPQLPKQNPKPSNDLQIHTYTQPITNTTKSQPIQKPKTLNQIPIEQDSDDDFQVPPPPKKKSI